MSSKLKIFQYHNSHLYNLKQYRIALEVGVYNSREGFLSVLGSNQRIVGGEPLLDLQKLYQFVHLVRSYTKVKKICELSSPYAHGCQTDITHYFDSLSLMHDIQILLKRSCFLVEPSKTATFSDLVKVVGKRIKNEKHKFGVLYENGKLESHWLTNEEINNKTR